jgi:hypothetical protein
MNPASRHRLFGVGSLRDEASFRVARCPPLCASDQPGRMLRPFSGERAAATDGASANAQLEALFKKT